MTLAGEALPVFRYHPDPVATGMIGPSAGPCPVCGEDRGRAYASSPFCDENVAEHRICPWCIADGAAARQFGAIFTDEISLVEAGLPEAVIIEVCERTPGYIGWQQEPWLAHCGDACEYHGDAGAEDVAGASEATRAAWVEANGSPSPTWDEVLGGYDPDQSGVGVYKFVCRHCRLTLFHWDMA